MKGLDINEYLANLEKKEGLENQNYNELNKSDNFSINQKSTLYRYSKFSLIFHNNTTHIKIIIIIIIIITITINFINIKIQHSQSQTQTIKIND